MKRNLTLKRTAIIMAVFSALIFNACAPIKEFKIMPAYDGANHYSYRLPALILRRKQSSLLPITMAPNCSICWHRSICLIQQEGQTYTSWQKIKFLL